MIRAKRLSRYAQGPWVCPCVCLVFLKPKTVFKNHHISPLTAPTIQAGNALTRSLLGCIIPQTIIVPSRPCLQSRAAPTNVHPSASLLTHPATLSSTRPASYHPSTHLPTHPPTPPFTNPATHPPTHPPSLHADAHMDGIWPHHANIAPPVLLQFSDYEQTMSKE